jgi:hypothetical protein
VPGYYQPGEAIYFVISSFSQDFSGGSLTANGRRFFALKRSEAIFRVQFNRCPEVSWKFLRTSGCGILGKNGADI